MSESKNTVEEVTAVDCNTTNTTSTVSRPVQNENLEALGIMLGSITEAAKIKGKLTMQDCRQIRDAKDILVDYFTLEDGETELGEPSRIETDSLAILIKILEIQQETGVFSIEGSIKILECIEKLSDAVAEKKSVSQKMQDARRRLKNNARK